MDSTSSTPPSLGQRTLAVIVFTDVADFSTRVGQNEESTLTLVKRDLELMTRLCTTAGGYVLKNTGDGLLMYFNSAVQAVQCAMDIQKRLADEAEREVWPAEPLQHRIGIHLGDVFVNGGDVLGDGVNIASRLESQAAPGGICISQTVYDVVRNKLNFQAQCLGPRQLKHISEPVTIYHIGKTAPPGAATAPAAIHAPRRGASRTLWIAAGILSALILLAAIGVGLKEKTAKRNAGNGRPGRQRNLVQNQSPGTDTTQPTTPAETGKAGVLDIIEARKRFQPGYDFSGMVGWFKEHGVTEQTPIGGIGLKRFSKMASMRDWFESTMQKYTEANPLAVQLPQANPPQTWSCWSQDRGRIMIKYPTGSTASKTLADLKPGMLRLMTHTLVQDQAAKGIPASPDVLEGLRIFAQEYHLHGKDENATTATGTQ